ncbi:MAG: spore maturation protein [Deltaproteobacteria bacterium RIFCSPLOWO2_02_FULL_50_16]|nr:MAG: spore maturation protein [Deltaproteobacteria bacterium RIFCSPLOWO2_02_FULL_50_16]
MLNWIWLVLVLGSVIVAAFTGRMEDLTQTSMESAKEAVLLSIGLIGVMAFWLGLMRVAQDGGLLQVVSRGVRPVMRRLFPEIPEDHPSMSMMIMNIASNMLGLGNAATPFGLKAMMELNRLNPAPGVATNAMCLFLAINTSNVALFPLGAMAMRASAGSLDVGGIMVPTFLATSLSTVVAIVSVKFLERLPRYKAPSFSGPVVSEEVSRTDLSQETPAPSELVSIPRWVKIMVSGVTVGGIFSGFVYYVIHSPLDFWDLARDFSSHWLIPLLIVSLVLYGFLKGVKIYESLVEGAKEGFSVAMRIIPYLVAILVAVGLFRASGALDFLVTLLTPLTSFIGMPAETLPMALLRPLSGSGAFAVMTETMKIYGPDSLIGYIVSTIQGSTETTFYILAVYCGAISVKNVRHALPACLMADLAGILAAVWLCRLFFL